MIAPRFSTHLLLEVLKNNWPDEKLWAEQLLSEEALLLFAEHEVGSYLIRGWVGLVRHVEARQDEIGFPMNTGAVHSMLLGRLEQWGTDADTRPFLRHFRLTNGHLCAITLIKNTGLRVL